MPFRRNAKFETTGTNLPLISWENQFLVKLIKPDICQKDFVSKTLAELSRFTESHLKKVTVASDRFKRWETFWKFSKAYQGREIILNTSQIMFLFGLGSSCSFKWLDLVSSSPCGNLSKSSEWQKLVVRVLECAYWWYNSQTTHTAAFQETASLQMACILPF